MAGGIIILVGKERTPVKFGVTSLPTRKSKALYIGEYDIVAYFRNDESAAKFEAVIDTLLANLPSDG